MTPCDCCYVNEAQYEIVLMDGIIFEVCAICAPVCINENACTENHVFSMTELPEN